MVLYAKPREPSFTDVPRGEPFRQASLTFSPPWLSGFVGARFMYTCGLMWDTLAERERLGVIQRFPTVAQPDALAPLGKDRKIWRGISETDASYAARLRQFKTTWKLAGNAPTLLRQLWAMLEPGGATRIRYIVNGYDGTPGAGTQFADWWTIDSDGLVFERVSPSNWNWDANYGANIRFWVIVYRTDLTPAKWGIPPYEWAEPGLLWGAEPGSNTDWIVDTYNVVQAFKAAGSHMGPYPGYGGGLIVADPTYTSAPWGPLGPFAPSYSVPVYPMPNGNFNIPANRPPGAVYLSGL